MATAQLQYRVNSGALHEDSIAVAGGDVISFTAANFAGWGRPAARWEIIAYPLSWPVPSGWSTDSSSGAYYYLANSGPSGVTPPNITIPATSSYWGKWLFQLTVNGTTKSSKIGVETVSLTLALHDKGYGESSQFGGKRGHVGPEQENLRAIDNAALFGGGTERILVDAATTGLVAGVPIRATPATINVAGASAVVPWSFAYHRAAGAFGAALKLKRTILGGSGAPDTSTGADLQWWIPNNAVTPAEVEQVRLRPVLTTIAGANLTTDFQLHLVNAGTLGNHFVWHADGSQTWDAYPEGLLRVHAGGLVTSSPLDNVEITAPLVFVVDDATQTDATGMLTLRHTYNAGFGGANIGASLGFEAEDSAGNAEDSGFIVGRLTTATNGAEVSQLELWTRTGGAAAAKNGYLSGAGVWTTTGAMVTDARFDTVSAQALAIGTTATSIVLRSTTGVLTQKLGADTIATLGPSNSYLTLSNANIAGVTFGIDIYATTGDAQLRAQVGGYVLSGNTVGLLYSAGALRLTIDTTCAFTTPVTATVDDATANGLTSILTLTHTTTDVGNGAAGIGTRIVLRAEDAGGNTEDTGYITSALTTATNGAEVSEIALWTRTGGAALAKNATLSGAGILTVIGGLVAPSLDNSGAGLTLGADTTSQTAGKSGTTWTQSGALTVTENTTAPRIVSSPATPVSSGGALAISLASKSNVKHATTEVTTVAFSGATEGMDGTIEFIQGGTGYAVTLPANGDNVEYEASILALGVGSIVDSGAGKRTVLTYYVTGSPNTRVFIKSRAVSTIP